MTEDFIDFAITVLGALAITASIGVLVAAPFIYLDRQECHAYADPAAGIRTEVRNISSCYVNDGTRWYAWSEWKLRGATRGQ